MKIVIIALFFFAFIPTIDAQVSGRVTNQAGEPLSFINVLLQSSVDTAFIKGTLTDELGAFLLENVAEGDYLISLSGIGYGVWFSDPFRINQEEKTKAFGRISLTNSAIELDGVEVRAKKMLMQQVMEGTVINVGSSLMTQGSSALQVLERSPGVFIDRQNHTVSLNGQNGVTIMVNGKRLQLSVEEMVAMLEGMSADNIEKVELLTSPSAKYDAAGGGGMINIVMKKTEEEGTNGAFSLSGGYGVGEKAMTSLNVNHRKGGSNFYGNYAYTLDKTASGFHGIGSEIVPVLGGNVNFDFLNDSQKRLSSHNLTIGMEKTLHETTLVGASILLQQRQDRADVFNFADYDLEADSLIRMRVKVGGNNRWENMMANFFVEEQWAKNGKIKLDADYLQFDSQNSTIASSLFFNKKEEVIMPGGPLFSAAHQGYSRTAIHIGVLKLDIEKQIHPYIRLEAGLKGTYSATTNISQLKRKDQDSWVVDARATTSIKMDERVGAAYTSFHLPFNASTNLTLGARYEYWRRTAEAQNRQYGRLFPSLFFSKQLSEVSQLQLSYTQRITRPDYNDLASYLVYNGPISVFTGNPLLKPTITNNLKLAYQFKAYNFSLFYKKDENPIVRYQIVENATSDLVLIAPQNMAYQRSVTAQMDIPVEITPWWNWNAGFAGSWRRFKLSHTETQVEKSYFTFNLYGSHTFDLPQNITIELSGWYNAPSYDGSRHYKGFGMFNAGVSKQLKNNQGRFQLTATDIFQSMRILSDFGQLTKEAFSTKTNVEYQAESALSPIVKLTYFRSFGNGKLKEKQKRETGSETEKARIGQ